MAKIDQAKLVMLWRRVKDLDAALNGLQRGGVGWRLMGADISRCTHAIAAESLLVGHWLQDKQALDAGHAVRADYETSDMIFNPATEIVTMGSSQDLEGAATALGADSGAKVSVRKFPEGNGLSFVDDFGNQTTVVEPSQSFLRSSAGRFASSAMNVMSKRSMGVLTVRKMVRNLAESTEFYRDVLKMKLVGGRKEVRFQPGLAQIALVEETSVGTLRTLRDRNRLVPDWIMLYVDDIEGAVGELSEKGVRFRHGIEQTDYGRVAHFSDPNGHSIALWKKYDTVPEGGTNVWPYVNKILQAARSIDQ